MKTCPALLLAAIAALCLSGCVSTEYRAPNGARFKRIAFGNKQSIGKVEFDPATGKLKMEGYSNDQTEIAATVAQAVATGIAAAKTP